VEKRRLPHTDKPKGEGLKGTFFLGGRPDSGGFKAGGQESGDLRASRLGVARVGEGH
jgi:hypothetical protein